MDFSLYHIAEKGNSQCHLSAKVTMHVKEQLNTMKLGPESNETHIELNYELKFTS
jgi:hypothetical protein